MFTGMPSKATLPRWLDDSWLDVRLGLRLLRKFPGLTLVGGVGMAVAIAISTAMFAFFYAYLYSTLPVDDGDRVVALENWDVDAHNEERQAIHDFADWRREMKTMEEVGAFRTIGRNLIVPGGTVEPARIAETTASGFRIVRATPVLGRTLVDDDERKGAPPVAVIGHDVWQSRFAADPGIVGREIRFGGVVHTVVGVMPEGFRFPVNHSYWTPLRADPADYQRGAGPELFVFGRLADGATVEEAQAELSAIGLRAAAAFPTTHAKLRPRVLPYAYPILDIQDVSVWQVAVMQFIVSLLLVVVAVNVAILIYARTATRQGEIAVRTALGASRRRIVGQLFIEALVLAGVAAALGLVLARVGLDQAHRIMQAEGARPPYWIDYGLPAAAVFYILVLAAVAAVIAGVLPALHATGRSMHSTLRALGGSTGAALGRTWTVLIVAQVAFAVAALPVAVMTAWHEVRSTITNPVFAAEQFLAASVSMDPEPPPGIDPAAHQRALGARAVGVQSDLVGRLEAESWVSDITLAMRPPGEEDTRRIELAGAPADGAPVVRNVGINQVDLDFFGAFDTPLLTGRSFTAADHDGASAAVIVNRAFVRHVLGEGDALGRRLRYVADNERGDRTEPVRWYEIVGVVGDSHANALDPDLVAPVLYHPFVPAETTQVTLVVRIAGGTPAQHLGRLREIAAAVDPTVRLGAYPLVAVYEQQRLAFRLMAAALGLVVATVLLLSAAGIYALMSFTVSQRRKEIGIRAALGADAGRLLRSIFARAARQLAYGVAAGVAIAILLDRLSDGELLGAGSAILLTTMSALMIVVGLLASVGPARRGLRIQPTEALRDQ
jgi:putative ABC transport system permease protein